MRREPGDINSIINMITLFRGRSIKMFAKGNMLRRNATSIPSLLYAGNQTSAPVIMSLLGSCLDMSVMQCAGTCQNNSSRSSQGRRVLSFWWNPMMDEMIFQQHSNVLCNF